MDTHKSALPRVSASQARTQFASVVKAAQSSPVEITNGDQPVAVLIGHDSFALDAEYKSDTEGTLRALVRVNASNNSNAQIAELQRKAREILAKHFPPKKLTLNDILAKAAGGVPIDRDFLNAPPVGKERL